MKKNPYHDKRKIITVDGHDLQIYQIPDDKPNHIRIKLVNAGKYNASRRIGPGYNGGFVAFESDFSENKVLYPFLERAIQKEAQSLIDDYRKYVKQTNAHSESVEAIQNLITEMEFLVN